MDVSFAMGIHQSLREQPGMNVGTGHAGATSL